MRSYKIIVLGASGSGKTVYLASLYKHLLAPDSDSGLFLKVDDAQRKKLLDIYTHVEDPKMEWPSGTDYREITEWTFMCSVATDEQPSGHDALHFSYLDYAGGRITNADATKADPLSAAFTQHLNEADIFLGFLDGQKLLALLRGEPAGGRFLKSDLANILGIMQLRGKPAQFVITKWDLLEAQAPAGADNNQILEMIRDRLLKDETFRRFVHKRARQGLPVRLIPVSAVGPGFAQLQPDGRMQKNPGVEPHCFQVEVPLMSVVIDQFKACIKYREGYRDTIKNSPPQHVKPAYSKRDNLGHYAAIALSFAAPPLIILSILLGSPVAGLQRESVNEVLKYLESGRSARQLEAQKQEKAQSEAQAATLAATHDHLTAERHAVASFVERLKRLEQAFPASDLSSVKAEAHS